MKSIFRPARRFVLFGGRSNYYCSDAKTKTTNMMNGKGGANFLWDEYKLLKTNLDASRYQQPIVNPKAVFANNELNLGHVEGYGFDYDYTLAVYKTEVNSLIYELGRERLIKDFKYPPGLKEMPYDPLFAVRGLHYDVDECILLKLDAFCQLQLGTAYRGKVKLSDDEVRSVYNGLHVPQNYIEPESLKGEDRMKQLLDLFSLPDVGLLTNVVEYFQNNAIDFDRKVMFNDVKSAIRQVHSSGDFYKAVGGDVEKYIHKNPGLSAFFDRLRTTGKTVFLVTNSPYSFINAGLKYLLGEDWRRLFNYIIVLARKPQFFTDTRKPFRVYREEMDGLSWERVSGLKTGLIYAEGNLEAFLQYSSIGKKNVLYFGDHMYSDLAEPMLRLGWRTGAIVAELEKEIEIQNTDFYRTSITWLIDLTWLIERYEDRSRADPSLSAVIRCWHDERFALMHRLKAMFNPQFGSIFRTFHHPSYFSRRLMRLADIYTSRLPNLLQYGVEHTFYPRRFALAHESHFGLPTSTVHSSVTSTAASTGA